LRPRLSNEERKKATDIIQFLSAIKTLNAGYFLVLDEKANELFSEYEEMIENRIETEDMGLKEGYYGGIPNFVIRIACLFRINRMTLEDLKELDEKQVPIIQFTEKDMKLSIKFGEIIWGWFEKMMALRTKHSSEAEKVRTTEEFEALLFSIYMEKNTRELPQNYLRTKSKIQTDKMVKILEGIAYRKRGKSSGGRHPILWVLKENIKL
jgi:hypothetical protein